MADVSPHDRNSKFNFELNLVPFIDLLSVLVLFLLATSVFESLRSFQLPLDGKTASESVASGATAIALPKFLISVKSDYVTVSWGGESVANPIALETKDLSAQLEKILKELKIETANIEAEKGIAYGKVIAAMDEVKSVGINKIALVLKP